MKQSFKLKPVLFFLMILSFFYQSTTAQMNEKINNQYELVLKAERNAKIRIEVIVVKNGKSYARQYTTPVRIKYPSSDMVICVKKLSSSKKVDFKLSCVDSMQMVLNSTSTAFSHAKFEVSNGFISVSKLD